MELSLTYIAKYIFKMHITERKQFHKLTHRLEEIKYQDKIVIPNKLARALIQSDV